MSWSRPGRDLLVLGGGGAKGAFEWGVLSVLWGWGIRPDAVWGVSVGSLVGFCAAAHDMDMLDGIFSSIRSPKQILKKRFLGLIRKPPGQYSMEPLMRNFIRTHAQKRRLVVPYYPIWTSLKRGSADGGSLVVKEAREYDSDAVLQRAMQASSAIPIIMQPPMVYDELGVDGGVIDVVPMVYGLEDAEPGDRVWVVACRSPDDVERWTEKKVGAVKLLERMENVALAERIRADLCDHEISLARERGVEVQVIWPSEDHGTTLDFYQKNINGWKCHGQELAERLMYQWYPDEDPALQAGTGIE